MLLKAATLGPHREPTSAFDYSAMSQEQCNWFQRTRDDVRSLAYRTACDMIRIGQLLAAARDRVDRRTFTAWILAELPWSRSHAYRLIQVGETFGALVDPKSEERIEPTALYLLARPEVPPQARAYAIELAADRNVTAADAREILAAHRSVPDLTREEVKAHDANMKSIRDEEGSADRRTAKAEATDTGRVTASWESLTKLVAESSVVHIVTIGEEGGDSDEDEPLYSVTVYADDDRPRNFIRRSLADAIQAAAGKEREKVCAGCETSKPLSMFSNNKALSDGRTRRCKHCERNRLSAFKRKKKAAKKAANESRESVRDSNE